MTFEEPPEDNINDPDSMLKAQHEEDDDPIHSRGAAAGAHGIENNFIDGSSLHGESDHDKKSIQSLHSAIVECEAQQKNAQYQYNSGVE